MASVAPSLHLFPSSTLSQPPRKSSLKKPKTYDVSPAPGELKGVAFEVKPETAFPGVIQPAENHIKHSLFCEPSNGKPGMSNQGAPKRRLRALRRSSGESTISSSPLVETEAASHLDEDQLSPLPENTNFGSPTQGKRDSLQRPRLPATISTQVEPDEATMVSPGGDGLSPLPDRQAFANTSPSSPEDYPAPRPLRAGSPSLARSNSTATTVPPYSPGVPGYTPPNQSIFPRFDPSKPVSQQQYYPTARSPSPALPSEKISKLGSPTEHKPTLQRIDSARAFVDGYEQIPFADSSDLSAVWNASCGNFPVGGRKVQLDLLQPRGQGTSLAIGMSTGELLYSMEKDSSMAPPSDSTPPKQLLIKKHSQEQTPATPVVQLALPDCTKTDKTRDKEVVTIFPQMAAIQAVEIVASSPAASAIATFDPFAASPQAVRLAQDAVSEAHFRYRCELVRSTRKRESLGTVTATYRLDHPMLGSFPVTITKSTVGRHSRDSRAKISLHHPSATPAAVSAETLVLAFLDFARDACVLDTPGLLALEGPYIIDTVVSALLAVAVIENDALMAETLTFDAPPKAPLPVPKSKRGSRSTSPLSSGSNDSKRSSKWFGRKKKAKKELEGEQVDLPIVTQGALALLGFSFKTAVWLLGAGVKMTAGVIIGVSHVASKA